MTDQALTLEIRYQTAMVVPPPYAHYYTLVLTMGEELAIDFSITYTDREELDEEEIVGEGFTLQDDFSWAGTLPEAWRGPLDNHLNRLRLKPFNEQSLQDTDDYFLLMVRRPGSEEESGRPSPRADWQYLAQELMQACYEAGGKERPFELNVVEQERGQTLNLQLVASFKNRDIRLETDQQGRKGSRILPWEDLRNLMETVYAIEYLAEEAVTRPPRRDGLFLNLGEENWFEWGKTAVDAGDGALDRLRKTLRRLREEP